MPTVRSLFATRVYEASLATEAGFKAFNADLLDACRMLAEEDTAGQVWCREHGYGGYTSYASLDDLPSRATVFEDLKRRLDAHAKAFAREVAFDLGPRGKLRLDSLWVNVLNPGAAHSGHIHPHSVISGTLYAATPKGSAGLRLEDPRLPQMMAAPPRSMDAPEDLRSFVTLTPAVGTILMWESWLRHEVPAHGGRAPRVSVSFNYAWR